MIPTDVAVILITLVAGVYTTYMLNGFSAIKKTIKEFIKECKDGRQSK